MRRTKLGIECEIWRNSGMGCSCVRCKVKCHFKWGDAGVRLLMEIIGVNDGEE